MAIFKSQVLTQASGSVGGMTYTRTRSGLTLRARSMPVNPSTPYQQAMRSIQSQLSQAWQTTLTDLQREGWTNYALEIGRKNRLGDVIKLTGIAMYTRCNSPRLQAALARVDDAPLDYTLGDPVTGLAGTTVAGDPNVFGVTWTKPQGTPPTSPNRLLISVSRPMSPTRIFFKGPYRYNKAADWGAAQTTINTDLLPQPIGEGNKVVIRARISYEDGRLSDAVEVSVIATVPIPGTSE